MFYCRRVIFLLAFQYQSAGHFAKVYGCWQPVMYQMHAIKDTQAVSNTIRNSDGQRGKTGDLHIQNSLTMA